MNRLNSIDVDWAWRPYEPSSDHPWDERLAAHLFRRAGFGADQPTLQAAVKQLPAEVVDTLFSPAQESAEFRAMADGLAQTVLASGNAKQLSAAWVYRLLFTPDQLLERVTLFWHSHFATSAEKVTDAELNWQQHRILREHAVGDFSQLTQAIAQDPAMLIYLDSSVNRKSHPNENFARELMELFCLGEGNYSEQDVQELARCFTGWEIKNNRFRKNRYQQDTGQKTVLGRTGAFDGEQGVQIVLQQPQVAQFLALKWFRYFIADEPLPPPKLLQPLADVFRQHNLQIAPALKTIFKSNLFYSQHSVGRRIKSPIEFVVGTLRSLRATTNAQLIADRLLQIGQGLFYPPNVKGWDGGRAWINSSTLLGRSNLIADILANDATRFEEGSLTEHFDNLGIHTTEQAINHLEKCLLPSQLNQATKLRLNSAYGAQSRDREKDYRSLLLAFVSLPQCQLG